MAKTTKKNPKTILKLPDSEQSDTAVLNSLASPSSGRFTAERKNSREFW